MPRLQINDERVQWAIAQRYRRKQQQAHRALVLGELRGGQARTFGELMKLTELSREDCGAAVDQLRRWEVIERSEDGRFGLRGTL